MVAGHLQEKKGLFYMVLSYKDCTGKRRTKWFPTGLPVKGNKKRAETMLMEMRHSYVPEDSIENSVIESDMLFADYLDQWLKIVKSTIKLITYASYVDAVEKRIKPYFREQGITLSGLQASDIQRFYTIQLERVKPTTVIYYHAVIHRALKYAVKTDLILSNPADKVDRPRKEAFQAGFYDKDELNALFEAVKGSQLEIPVMLAGFYGLRRSEVLGLKWDAIDFNNNTITIRHTITTFKVDGKQVTVASDTTKTKSSMRTLPLVPLFRERLLALRAEQQENRRLSGKSYNMRYIDYICVDEIGDLTAPNYVTGAFPKLLERNGLRHIRFHDLRHSCASMLLSNGVAMKQIQEWLGHSDFSTTANIYAHLDYNSKLSSAEAMQIGLGLKAAE
ncbi:MAG: site-specific integrase [Clostridia bacterium]|nr:site-specific integrase [Clostridia bacterium]MBQ4159218.1 site-specific integrase [Clostridia bacterium]